MRILYVEDDPVAADLTCRSLRRQVTGIQIEVVHRQADALTRLDTNRTPAYDIVLTDLRLPDGDGLSLLTEIRERSLPLAVVVITGAGDEETAVAALKAGADDYLVKRMDYLDRLPLTLETALDRRRAEIAKRARRITVLYAERNPADIDITRRHLARHAPYIRLETVATGPDVLSRLGSGDLAQAWDVVLLDYRLPGLDALDLLKEIQERRIRAPVILVTGQGDEEVVVQALRLGATSYVIKNPGYLHRLPVEIENAFFRAKLVREQEALLESEARYRTAAETASLMARRLTTAQEEERARIASDLHDDLSQRAAALTFNLARVRQMRTDLPFGLREDVARLETQAAALAEGIRRISHELHPAVLKHIGLVAALRLLGSDVAGISVHVAVRDDLISVPASIELCLYRVVQESLHNAARHSGAAVAHVSLSIEDQAVVLTIDDRGNGFDLAEARHRGGLGLISMEERVRLAGGSIVIDAQRGSGTRIHVRVPVDALAPDNRPQDNRQLDAM